jgi:hypothetical protein
MPSTAANPAPSTAGTMPWNPILEVDSARAVFEAELMDQAPYHLDQI